VGPVVGATTVVGAEILGSLMDNCCWHTSAVSTEGLTVGPVWWGLLGAALGDLGSLLDQLLLAHQWLVLQRDSLWGLSAGPTVVGAALGDPRGR
jgi:hypothetical protein